MKSVGTTSLLWDNPPLSTLDAFREIRTNLLARMKATKGQTLLVVSTGPCENRSVAAANLAASVAQLGHRVLLADCSGELAGLIPGEDCAAGLSGYLSGAELSSVVVPGPVPNLDVLHAGKQQAGLPLLDSGIEGFLAAVKRAYDYAIVDCSPLSNSPDALILAEKCDGVALAVRRLVTRHPALCDAVNKLANLNANIVGFVLTE